MTTLELLQQSAPELGRRVAAVRPAELRRVALALAAAALEGSGLKHPTIESILRSADASFAGNESLRLQVEAIAKELDKKYFELDALSENEKSNGESPREVSSAFRKARAASAVAAAFLRDSRDAAIEAAYEALAATDSAENLVKALDEITSNPRPEEALTLLDLLVVLAGGVPAVIAAHYLFTPKWIITGSVALTLIFGAGLWCFVFIWLIPRLTRGKGDD